MLINSNEAWLGEVPADWTPSRIRNVASLSPSASRSTPAPDENCTVVPMELLSESGIVDISNRQVFEEVQAGLTLFEAGDVLFAKITPCMENGKGALVQNLPTRYGLGSTEFHVLRPSFKVDGQFLYYYTFNPFYRDYAAENMTGAAGQKRVSSRFIKDSRIYLPNIEEQRCIAAFLDISCRAIDATIEVKHSQIAALDNLRKALITRAVTRGLDESVKLNQTGNVWMDSVPDGWGLISLKRVAEIQTGLTLGKVYEGPLIERPYLRVANVQDGHLALDEVTTIEVPASVAERVELRPNDVLMTEGGDLDKLGRGFLWSGEIEGCLHQNHIFAVRCYSHKLLPRFLTYLTSSQYGRDYFEATGKRTTNLASTNSTKVGMFPLPLPSTKEQGKIVEFLDSQLNQLREIKLNLESQIEVLVSYRKSLIHECVTGKRRITERELSQVQAHA